MLGGSAKRVLYCWCKGLLQEGCEVTVLTLFRNKDLEHDLPEGTRLVYEKVIKDIRKFPTFRDLVIKDMLHGNVSSKMARFARKYKEPDFYILMDDYALSISKWSFKAPLGYYCQGLPQTLGFTLLPSFLQRFPKLLQLPLRTFSVPLSLKVLENIRKFDFVLANSKYTAEILHYFTGIYPKIIHQPIDTELFKPERSKGVVEKYLLAYGDGSDKEILEEIATNYPVKNIGKSRIRHAENVGWVSSIEVLRQLYSDAFMTVFPQLEEPFGFIPVESMACGTPVLAYNSQGPSETIRNGVTGWLADTADEFRELLKDIWINGYPQKMRSLCREHVVSKFSTRISAKALLDYLNHV
ncbi:MAG: glycosyltransferase [Candidatus Bathyarchaeia archaeon]